MNYEHYTEVNLFDICDDVFHENETYGNDVWSKECVNRILQLGSGISGGKERIYSFFTRYDFSLADRAKFLKNEYGIGGRSYDFKNQNQDHGFVDHDSKGLTVYVYVSSKDSSSLFKNAESKTFSWADVSLRIEKLIATGNYFTDEEMEHYNSMNKNEILPDWLLKRYDIIFN